MHELHKHNISPFALVLVRDCFQRYDKAHTGLLPAHLFQDCLQAAGNKLPSKVVNLLIAFCIVLLTQDDHHTASFSRLQGVISAYEMRGNLGDIKQQIVQKLEERFGSGVKAFAFFDEDKVKPTQDGLVHVADFYQAATSLGFPRRQEEVKALFQSLKPGTEGQVSYSQFMTLFARTESASPSPPVRPSPRQMGVYIQHSKAPPAKVLVMQLDEYIADEPKGSPQRKWHLPSDRDPSHIYGRPPARNDRIEDLLSHSFMLPKKAKKLMSPKPLIKAKQVTVTKLPPFR